MDAKLTARFRRARYRRRKGWPEGLNPYMRTNSAVYARGDGLAKRLRRRGCGPVWRLGQVAATRGSD